MQTSYGYSSSEVSVSGLKFFNWYANKRANKQTYMQNDKEIDKEIEKQMV